MKVGDGWVFICPRHAVLSLSCRLVRENVPLKRKDQRYTSSERDVRCILHLGFTFVLGQRFPDVIENSMFIYEVWKCIYMCKAEATIEEVIEKGKDGMLVITYLR